MNKTPLFALCIIPGIKRSCAGVPNPPDCKGSCKTSPSNAPECAPVASINGAFCVNELSINNLGGLPKLLETLTLLFKLINKTNAAKNIMLPIKEAAAIMSP